VKGPISKTSLIILLKEGGWSMDIGANIRKLRKEAGLTQSELAQALKIPHRQLSRYELNISIPSVKNLIKLSDYFEVSTDQLIFGHGKEFVKKTKINDLELMDILRRVDRMKRPHREKIKWAFRSLIDGESIPFRSEEPKIAKSA